MSRAAGVRDVDEKSSELCHAVAAGSAEPERSLMASNERVRILVVDDEEIVRESLAGWLDKDGYTVEKAADGPSALARLEAGPAPS